MNYLKTFESYEANKELAFKILKFIEEEFQVKETEINAIKKEIVKYIVVNGDTIYLNGSLKNRGDAKVQIKYNIIDNLLKEWKDKYSESEINGSTNLAIKEFIKKNQS